MKKLPILFLLSSAIISCNKLNVEKCTPKCVESKINAFSKSSTCNNAKVDAFSFQGSTVYTFDPGNCGADMTTEVINSECNNLGYLGGFDGNTKINEADFSTATFIKTIWKK